MVDFSFTTSSPGTFSTTFTINSNATLGYNTLRAIGTSTATGGVAIGSQDDNLQIFPNPAKASITIKPNSITELTIVDLLGRIQYRVVGEGIASGIEVRNLPNGLYRVIAVDGGRTTTATLAVIH
jgi:hypothetical protein